MFDEKLFGIPLTLLAIAASVVAAIYLIWDLTGSVTGWRWLVLRWAHGLCWVLLAFAALAKTRIAPVPDSWAQPLAIAAGLVYAAFMVTNLTKS